MKAILVIDIEEDVDIKTLRANYEVYGDLPIRPCYQSNYQFREGVELKPMPQKMSWGHTSEYIDGYNACLEDITGETEW